MTDSSKVSFSRIDYSRVAGNCITKIPQDIKIELNNGILTLKAGSKIYVPNGFEQDGITKKFITVTVSNDLTVGEES